MVSRRLKTTFVVLTLAAIAVTLVGGWFTFEQAPPYPERVVTADGQLLTGRESVLRGQAVFQKYGLMDVGSVWGHGTYRGTEFTADTLHRIGQSVCNYLARAQYGNAYAELASDQKSAVDRATVSAIKRNTYDAASDTLTLSPGMVAAFLENRRFCDIIFSAGKRDSVIAPNLINDPGDRRDLADFFFWTAWAAGTYRPGKDLTYTNNWPPDASVGNVLSSEAMKWTVISIIAFLTFLSISSSERWS